MISSSRLTTERNLTISEEALKFASIFFTKQFEQKETLCDLYHDQSTLIWNGTTHKTKTNIAKFYQKQQKIETILECLDAQIIPPMGDIVDMITIVAGGKLKQDENTFNFSRVFLIGPNAPGSFGYNIVSDNMRTHNL